MVITIIICVTVIICVSIISNACENVAKHKDDNFWDNFNVIKELNDKYEGEED